ncbi:hypothetical protein ACIQBJ_12280 [Kitasatospora sp. NPDC088391]|uniref:hypothetical protein n=1 Tax=Kitasatospora sp. NPDC088391 TaxID=3364074 RepID=UPI003828F744
MTAARHPEALAAYAALLDHSVDRIAELASDARHFDRKEVHRLADVWDNNTHALFASATTPFRVLRGRAARGGLRWTADFGTARRGWVVETTAAAGFPVERHLRPPAPEFGHWRSHTGEICSVYGDLTAEVAAGLAAEYLLPEAACRLLQVERHGADRSECRFEVVLPSRAERTGRPPARLHLSGAEPTGLRFDSAGDTAGLRIEVTPAGVLLGLGPDAELRCRSVSYRLEDDEWHRTPTGRRYALAHPADAEPAPRRTRRPWVVGPFGEAVRAAVVLRAAMLAVRRVGHSGSVDRVPLDALTTALSGAGRDILAAGAHRSGRRDAAFRALADTWFDRGGPDFAREIGECGPGLPAGRPDPGPAPARPRLRSAPAQLRILHYEAANRWATPGEPSPDWPFVQLHFAQPPAAAGPWRMVGHRRTGPFALRLTPDALRAEATPELSAAALTAGPGLTVTGGDLAAD